MLEHQIDREAFVFSVPFVSDEYEGLSITATHAIFPVDGGKKAPASVVGYKMTHKSFYDRFIEITSKTDEVSNSSISISVSISIILCGNREITLNFTRFCFFVFQFSGSCTADERQCYILDHNAYIILSTTELNETGQFFGKREPSVMNDLIEAEIFRKIVIYDYQALCIEAENITSCASSLLTVSTWKFLYK